MGRSVCLPSVFVSFVAAAGKIAREEGKHDLGSSLEDGFPDNLIIPPTAAELVSNPHSSRSELSPRGKLSIMWECETGARSQIVLL